MDISISKAKQDLRKQMKQRLRAMTPAQRRTESLSACGAVAGLPAWREAELVLVFLSMPEEIQTDSLIDAAFAAGKQVAVPRIGANGLDFILASPDWPTWPRDAWQIPEPPAIAPELALADLSGPGTFIVLPGLAFDAHGGRLGRGKGYYDRFLERLERAVAVRPVYCGLCLPGQLVPLVPADSFDRNCDLVVHGAAHG